MEKLSIGLLDMGYREENKSPLSTIEEIIEYAVQADELNFSRFWLTEHHDDDINLSYGSPEMLIALIVGMTEKIKVGAAGVLAKIHEPYFTASNFKLLNNLFSNRIDLGLAKSNPDNHYLTNQVYDIKDEKLFERKVKTIYDLLHKEVENLQKNQLVLPPFKGVLPELWSLSVSYRNFPDAIKYKMNYCRSVLHGKGLIDVNYNRDELIMYKEMFYTVHNVMPKVTLALGISYDPSGSNKTVHTTSKFAATKNSNTIFINSMNQLHDLLFKYQDLYGIDEFIVMDTEANNRKKIQNIQAISDVFNLKKEFVNETTEII